MAGGLRASGPVLADAGHDDGAAVRAARSPRSRPRTSKLAARRFTSHSHGPDSVSSKSLMSNSIRRSGVPNRPKFDRWASPQSCTVTPDRGVAARSAAMISAAPR